MATKNCGGAGIYYVVSKLKLQNGPVDGVAAASKSDRVGMPRWVWRKRVFSLSGFVLLALKVILRKCIVIDGKRAQGMVKTGSFSSQGRI